jgi:hypothetical protein
MGYKRIITISEDATASAERSDAEWQNLRTAVGQAVLSLCAVEPIDVTELDRITRSERFQKAAEANRQKALSDIGSHHGAVRLVGREHSNWQRLYLFAGGILKPLYDATDKDLELAEQLIRSERSERAKRRASDSDTGG